MMIVKLQTGYLPTPRYKLQFFPFLFFAQIHKAKVIFGLKDDLKAVIYICMIL